MYRHVHTHAHTELCLSAEPVASGFLWNKLDEGSLSVSLYPPQGLTEESTGSEHRMCVSGKQILGVTLGYPPPPKPHGLVGVT